MRLRERSSKESFESYEAYLEKLARHEPTTMFSRVWVAVSTYLVTNLAALLCWLFFRVLNRTTVIGSEHVGSERNTLLLSNHQSMIDSFPIGVFAYHPLSWFKPYLLPWNPAAIENFYKSPTLAWFAKRWRCIPVRQGRRDARALRQMAQLLPTGVMIVFPEATRSRTGEVGEGRTGVGMLILRARPRVIPVAIDGMREVLPIGKKVPRVFKRVTIAYGPPVDYSEFLDQTPTREQLRALTEKVMETIRQMQREIREIRSPKSR